MLCQECGENKATVHLTKIINDKKTEVYLCQECAQKKGEFDFSQDPLSLHNFLTGFLGGEQPQQKTPSGGLVGVANCPNCGLSYNEFREKGRLGCVKCFDSFEQQLTPLIKRIHGREEHRGKVPARTGGLIRKKREIEKKRQEMEKAVGEENFEEAAKIRDEIKRLEKELEE